MPSFEFNSVKEMPISETEMIYDINFHPSKENVLSLATIEGDLKIIDLNADHNWLMLNFKRHHKGSPIRRVAFASDELLVSAAKTIKLLDVNQGKVIRRIDNNDVKIYSLLVIDNYLLCFGDDEGNFKIFDYRVDRGVYAHLKECEEYLSDLDVDQDKRIVVAASGEGTLSAFNIRAKRMESPQSELFDAGFQSVRFLEAKNKVVVGAEDGALNIFNVNEWGNISDRFPIRGQSSRGQGSCSIDKIELIDEETILAGSSDGKLRAISILPNKILDDVCFHRSSVESLAVNHKNKRIASTNDNILILTEFSERVKGSKSKNNERAKFFDGFN